MEEKRSLTELATLLKARYCAHATIERLFYPNHPLPIEQCYLDLALIENKNFHDQKKEDQSNMRAGSRDYFLHSYEHIQHSQCKLAPEQLLTECHSTPKRIYIEGAAGAGKTTLSQFIAYQWSKGHPNWIGYDFLFRIRLRDLTTNNYPEQKIDFIEMLEKECFRLGFSDSLTKTEKVNLSNYLKSKDKKVLVILDGYDELSLESNAIKMLWKNLIDSTYDFIIMSRPGMLKAELKTNLNVAVLGFSDEQVKRYIQYFFDLQHTPDAQPQDAPQCLQTLRQNPNLWSLAHTPIQLELLCSMWNEELQQISDITLTRIYTLMLEQLLKRHEQKRLKKEENNEVILREIDILPLLENAAEYFEFLENVAFLSMERNKLVISSSIIEDAYNALKNKSNNKPTFFRLLKALGFITRDSDGRQMEFIHLTFQEYFAARYIVRCFREQQAPTSYATLSEFIQRKKYHRGYEIIWWFIAGLLKDDNKLLEQFIFGLESHSVDFAKLYNFNLLLKCLVETELQLNEKFKQKIIQQLINWIQYLFLHDDTPIDNALHISAMLFDIPAISQTLDNIINNKQKLYQLDWKLSKPNFSTKIIKKLLDLLNDTELQEPSARILARNSLLHFTIFEQLVKLLENPKVRKYAAIVLYHHSPLPENILERLIKLWSNDQIREFIERILYQHETLSENILQKWQELLEKKLKVENLKLKDIINDNNLSWISKISFHSETLLKEFRMERKNDFFLVLAIKNHTIHFPLYNKLTLTNFDHQYLVNLLANLDCQNDVSNILSNQKLSEPRLKELVELLNSKSEQAIAEYILLKQIPLSENILEILVKLANNNSAQENAARILSCADDFPENILDQLIEYFRNDETRSFSARSLSGQTDLPKNLIQYLDELLDNNKMQVFVIIALSSQINLSENILQKIVKLLNNIETQSDAANLLSHHKFLPEAVCINICNLIKDVDIQKYVVEALSNHPALPESVLCQLIKFLDDIYIGNYIIEIFAQQTQLPKSILIMLSQFVANFKVILSCIQNASIGSLCTYLNSHRWEASNKELLKLILLKCLEQKVALYFYKNQLYVGGEGQEEFSSECQMRITETMEQLFTEITGIPTSTVIELETDIDQQINEKNKNNLDFTASKKEPIVQEQRQKYDIFINEIKVTKEAIEELITHADLKTKVTQELSNINSELEKAKSRAGNLNELIRSAAQATYDSCINAINYLKILIAQEKGYPAGELKQVCDHLENIVTKVSPKIELHSYSVTQMQEVRSQGLFFTQRFLNNTLKDLSPLGKDFKDLLETIKTTMGSNHYSCFISYAQPIDEANGPDQFIQAFLETLGEHLLLAGFNPLLDFKCIEAGEAIETYMKQTLISNHWLLIGTPSLPQRLNQPADVTFETRIETFRKVNKLTNIYPMIPLLVVGNITQSLPWHKQRDNYIDLTQSSYLAGLKKLLQALSRIPEKIYNDLWKSFETKYPEHMQVLSASLSKQILQNEQQKKHLTTTLLENEQIGAYKKFLEPISDSINKEKKAIIDIKPDAENSLSNQQTNQSIILTATNKNLDAIKFSTSPMGNIQNESTETDKKILSIDIESKTKEIEQRNPFCCIKISDIYKSKSIPFFSVVGKEVDEVYDGEKLYILIKYLKEAMLTEIYEMNTEEENVEALYCLNTVTVNWIDKLIEDLKKLNIKVTKIRNDDNTDGDYTMNLELYSKRNSFIKIPKDSIIEYYEIFLLNFFTSALKYDIHESYGRKEKYNIYKNAWIILKYIFSDFSTVNKVKGFFEFHEKAAYKWIANTINNNLQQNEKKFKLNTNKKAFDKAKCLDKIKRRIRLFESRVSIKKEASNISTIIQTMVNSHRN